MKEDLRYKIQHTGDVIVGTLCDVISIAKSSARGIVLTYNINELRRRKRDIARKMGERLVQVRKDDPEIHVSEDETMKKLFSALDKIQKSIDAYVEERGV